MARTNIQPIVKTENAALAVRKGVGTGVAYAKAGALLGGCFLRTLFTGNVTETPRKPRAKRATTTRRAK